MVLPSFRGARGDLPISRHAPRAAYLLIDDGVSNIVRVDYDVEREARELRIAGHPDSDRLAAIRRTGRFAPAAPSS